MSRDHKNESDTLARGRSDASAHPEKKPFVEPKLRFVEPKLTKHGDVNDVTHGNGFLGTFTP